jgi:hypothetical protein
MGVYGRTRIFRNRPGGGLVLLYHGRGRRATKIVDECGDHSELAAFSWSHGIELTMVIQDSAESRHPVV